MTRTLVYLCSPYSHSSATVRKERFDLACEVAGELMRQGFHIFSPIAHTHPIAERCDLPHGWSFWQEYDKAILQCCRAVFVLACEGWEESVGIQAEIKLAESMGLRVLFVDEEGRQVSENPLAVEVGDE